MVAEDWQAFPVNILRKLASTDRTLLVAYLRVHNASIFSTNDIIEQKANNAISVFDLIPDMGLYWFVNPHISVISKYDYSKNF
jgi:hypothetical protein